MDQVLSVAAIIGVILSYPYTYVTQKDLPDKIPIHFNFKGEPDGYGSKRLLFIIPVLTTLLYIGLRCLPKCDKYKENYAKFPVHLKIFELSFVLFMNFVLYTAIKACISDANIILSITGAIGLLMVMTGISVRGSKMTQFFGCKCRYAYLSEEKWEYINNIGGIFMISVGIAMLASVLMGWKFMLLGGIITVIVGVVGLIGFSEWLYAREMRRIQEEQIGNMIM